MKKTVIFFFVFFSFISYSYSQQGGDNDSAYQSLGNIILKSKHTPAWNIYDPERGFFQKAFTDKGDPRFMITNEDETFTFGIGGFVNIIGFCDFNGMVENKDFVTSLIPVPNGFNRGQFVLGAESSRVNFKTVGKTAYGDIIAFMETDFRGTNNSLRLRHAYISYLGFTIGQTWSTFMDLEASPPTIDLEGPNTEISLRQPMMRYGRNFGSKFSFALAAEMNSVLIGEYPDNGIYNEYQRIPDFPVHFKYKDRFGHIQLGGILRIMNYLDDTITHKSQNELGFGVALSGKFNLGGNDILYFQSVYGEGIAKYIQDLSFSNLDLIIDLQNPGKLRRLPMFGSYVALQHYWADNIYSAAIYSFTKLNPPPEYDFTWMFNYSHYFAINLFWDFIPYGTIGIEYLFGQRVNQTAQKGNANRIDLMIRYGF